MPEHTPQKITKAGHGFDKLGFGALQTHIVTAHIEMASPQSLLTFTFLLKLLKKSSNPEKCLLQRNCPPPDMPFHYKTAALLFERFDITEELGVCPTEAAFACISVAMVTARQTSWQKVHRLLNPVCRRLSGNVADLIYSYFLL